MAIIDIHTHILYGIDDGATDLEMSLRLIDMEYDQGVRGIFLTNHSYGMEEKSRLYYVRFDEIAGICKERYPDLKLYKVSVSVRKIIYEWVEKIYLYRF